MTLAEKVAARLRDYGHDYDIAPTAVDEMLRRNAPLWPALADLVEAGDMVGAIDYGDDRAAWDAALRRLASALNLEDK